MEVVGVIDLAAGQVVHAVAGHRSEYQPIRSQLSRSAEPADVAQSLVEICRIKTFYLADLDAIAGREPDWTVYRRLLALDVDWWIDAGVASTECAKQLCELASELPRLKAIVLGLESLPDRQAFAQIFDLLGPKRSMFGLDLRRGVPIAQSGWQGLAAMQIAAEAVELGVERMLVLDVAAVGQGEGPSTLSLCAEIHALRPHVELATGGGVRDARDFAPLAAAGCRQVLVASALHSGAITAADVIGAASIAAR